MQFEVNDERKDAKKCNKTITYTKTTIIWFTVIFENLYSKNVQNYDAKIHEKEQNRYLMQN